MEEPFIPTSDLKDCVFYPLSSVLCLLSSVFVFCPQTLCSLHYALCTLRYALCRFLSPVRFIQTLAGIHPLDLGPVADDGFDHQRIVGRTAFDVPLGLVFLHA